MSENKVSIKLGDMDLETYDYLEDEEDNGTTFLVRFKLTYEEFDKLIDFATYKDLNHEYFTAKINDTEHTVRFGVPHYSKHDDHYKVDTVLVEKQLDDHDEIKTFLSNKEYWNLRERHVKQEIVLEKLFNLLDRKGVFHRDEIDKIQNVSDEKLYKEEILRLNKAEDIDDWDL